MDGKGRPDHSADRRAADRRVKEQPYPGGDKRIVERRTVADRRSAPRS